MVAEHIAYFVGLGQYWILWAHVIGRVSKKRLFILDLLLCDHSCISGDIALRIQHDVSRRHTKTSKPGHPPRSDFRDNFVFPWV